jgi:simple sugar transport system ATP-binding protein
VSTIGATGERAGERGELLRAVGIKKTYGRSNVLSDVSLEMCASEVIGLLGDNGAGKSTLIKILSGVVNSDAGSVFHRGRPVDIRSHRDSEALGIETIYQDIALCGSMSIMRNFFAGRELTNALGVMDVRRMREITMDVLKGAVQIAGIESPDQLVSSLSGGQAQAVAIARAVYFKKEILLLDEPTSALSVRETEKLLSEVVRLRDDGLCVVFVTHNLYHAFRICDRFVVLSRGRVVKSLKAAETSVEDLTQLIVAN